MLLIFFDGHPPHGVVHRGAHHPSCTEIMADRDLANVISLVEQIQPALERGERAKLNDIVERLVALRAPLGGQWQQLAYIAAGYGELTLARKAIDLLVEAAGGDAMAKFHKVAFLSTLGLWAEVDALLQTLPDTIPDPASNAYSRGNAALNLGRREEALRYLEHATRLRPQSGFAWFTYAMATDFSAASGEADRLIAAERGVGQASAQERVPYYYALGKLHADRGAHKLAFEAFARGAQLQKALAPYDQDADRADAAKAVEGYSADRIATIAGSQHERTDRTIFVAGLPRSGTTLLEQILTSHSAVSDGGEIARLFLLSTEVGGASWAPLARHVEVHGAEPAARLWNHWLNEQFPGNGRIVDKTVTTSRFLGLAAALLPEAPLIWMTRDPLDRAWSCFRTNFSGTAMPWSYDPADIAAHFRIEDQLLAQWQAILGDRLLVVPYEALVTDPDFWIRRVLSHCGLLQEPQVFAPHENRRPVATASMVQVRRPINRDAIGAAEPYRAFMGAFVEAYSA